MSMNAKKFAFKKRLMSGKSKPKCDCRRPGCEDCSTTESKARSVLATLIGEADFDPRDLEHEEMESAELEAAEHAGEHDETDMSIPEERTEVEIAHEILGALDNEDEDMESRHETIRSLCHELLDLHGKDKDEEEGGSEGGEQGDLEDFEAEIGIDK